MWRLARRLLVWWGALGCVLGGSLFLVYPSASASVGINPQLSFEGKVVKSDGTNITDGTYNMEFKIYQDGNSSGSGSTLKWTEDYLVSASQGVTVTNGTFQVNLGSITAFASSVDWNQSVLWLSMQVGGTSSCTPAGNFTANCSGDGEMTPYIRLTATPYALNADKLDGLDSTSLGQLASNQTWTGTNTIQPTTNITGAVIKQTSLASPTADIFNVQTANATNVIQVTGPSANNAAVSITSIGTGGLTLQSGTGTVSLGSSTVLNASGALSVNSGGANALMLDTGGTATLSLAPTNANLVLIGSNSTSNTTQHLLQLNSVSTFTEAASCSTSTNQGAVYYNTTTNSIRTCVNGAWEDVVTTAGLGIMLFGVVPDSGSVPGDLESTSTAGVSGPCKVSWASATSVTVQACTVYSGGRKIVQSSVTATLPAMTNGQFTHLCYYNGSAAAGPITNSTSWFTTPSTTETANLPTFNANNPVVCLATIKNASTGNTIAQVSDTRVFTNSIKRFVNGSVALSPGWITIATTGDTTKVTTTSTAATKGITGVVAAGNSAAWSSGGPNAIIVTDGPTEVEALAGATSAYNYIETGGTAGYATTVTTASTTLTLPNLYLGLALTAFGSCSTPSASACQGSLLTQILWGD